jgi:ribosomal protein L4
MKNKDQATYEVGYGKPPKRTQFAKGVSGNPAGRPKGSENTATMLARVMNEKVPVVENGRRRMVRKVEVAFTQLINKAVKGESRAMEVVIKLLPYANAELAADKHKLSQADEAVVASLLARLAPESGGSTPQSEGGGT